jgi:hypothetical protein
MLQRSGLLRIGLSKTTWKWIGGVYEAVRFRFLLFSPNGANILFTPIQSPTVTLVTNKHIPRLEVGKRTCRRDTWRQHK